MKASVAPLAFGLAILAGCEANPLADAGSSQLVASVEGGVTAAYEGSGEFSTTSPSLPRPIKFSLRSAGRGTASNQGFEFYSRDIPAVGIYKLGARSDGAGEPIHAVYSWRDGSKAELFSAQSGELVIAESSANRVSGTFHFSGLLTSVCTSVHSGAQSCTVMPQSGGGKQVTTSGSFEAVPARRLR